jgi:hypothetical protein
VFRNDDFLKAKKCSSSSAATWAIVSMGTYHRRQEAAVQAVNNARPVTRRGDRIRGGGAGNPPGSRFRLSGGAVDSMNASRIGMFVDIRQTVSP